MAYTVVPTDSYGQAAVLREDLLDEISIMSPVHAPMLYRLGFAEPIAQRVFSWPLDYVRAPEVTQMGQTAGEFGATDSRRSAYPEGADADFATAQAKREFANVACIVRRTLSVTGTMRASIQAGVSDEYNYEVYQRTCELVEQIDQNATFGVANSGSTGQAETNARMTHGIINWILWSGHVTTGLSAAIAGQQIPRSVATDRDGFSGTVYKHSGGAALTRTQFHDSCLQPAYQRGMNLIGAQLYCSSSVKRVLSQFAYVYGATSSGTPNFQLNERNVQARENFITERVDFFETDYGTISMNLSRRLEGTHTYAFLAGATGQDVGLVNDPAGTIDVDDLFFIIEPRFWRLSPLRGLDYEPLAKTGDADNAMLVMEFGVKALNPIAGILCNDVSGA